MINRSINKIKKQLGINRDAQYKSKEIHRGGLTTPFLGAFLSIALLVTVNIIPLSTNNAFADGGLRDGLSIAHPSIGLNMPVFLQWVKITSPQNGWNYYGCSFVPLTLSAVIATSASSSSTAGSFYWFFDGTYVGYGSTIRPAVNFGLGDNSHTITVYVYEPDGSFLGRRTIYITSSCIR